VQSRYFLGQVVKATVVASLDFGVFAEIEDGVEGLVHVSELVHSEGDWAEQYPNGKQILVEIIHIDAHERKISLSEKGAQERGGESGSADDYLKAQSTGSARLGDIMGDLSQKLGKGGKKAAPAEDEASASEEQPAASEEQPAAEDAEAEAKPAKKGGKKKVAADEGEGDES
jgi:predicted RNA-binding protein with RPS1 domain